MRTLTNAAASGALILIGMLSATGCAPDPIPPSSADAPDGRSLGSLAPGAPEGEVIGVGTVLDDGSGAKLCLGPIMESLPPQCHGIPLHEWDWIAVDGVESAQDVRWGQYAVTASYDGATLTRTRDAVPLALYSPLAPEPIEAGTATESELATIIDDVISRDIPGLLSAQPFEGRVIIEVVWDDGTLAHDAAADFGDDVLVRSALQPVA